MKKNLISILLAALLLAAPGQGLAAGEGSDELDSGIVTDAFCYDPDDEDEFLSFAVPKIQWEGDGIHAVNDAIWEELYEEQLYSEYGAMTAVEEGVSPEPYGMSYSWAVNGDVLSLWTVSNYSNDYNVYSIYNVSLSACRRITDQELLQVLGIDQEDFYALAAQVLSDTFEELSAVAPEDEFKAMQRQTNNDPANVHAVQPYLNENGDLCMVGWVSAMAGAGEYARQMTVLPADQLPEEICSADLPETPPSASPEEAGDHGA